MQHVCGGRVFRERCTTTVKRSRVSGPTFLPTHYYILLILPVVYLVVFLMHDDLFQSIVLLTTKKGCVGSSG